MPVELFQAGDRPQFPASSIARYQDSAAPGFAPRLVPVKPTRQRSAGRSKPAIWVATTNPTPPLRSAENGNRAFDPGPVYPSSLFRLTDRLHLPARSRVPFHRIHGQVKMGVDQTSSKQSRVEKSSFRYEYPVTGNGLPASGRVVILDHTARSYRQRLDKTWKGSPYKTCPTGWSAGWVLSATRCSHFARPVSGRLYLKKTRLPISFPRPPIYVRGRCRSAR